MKIVTDSGSDLTKEQCQELGVTMLPLKVQLGERTYLSGVDLSAEEFYELLDTTGQMPLTSTPSVGEFVDAYTKLAESDREILSIHISSGLSGTSNAARVAAKQVDADVTVVDTLTLSSGTGWQVEAAARHKSRLGQRANPEAAQANPGGNQRVLYSAGPEIPDCRRKNQPSERFACLAAGHQAGH